MSNPERHQLFCAACSKPLHGEGRRLTDPATGGVVTIHEECRDLSRIERRTAGKPFRGMSLNRDQNNGNRIGVAIELLVSGAGYEGDVFVQVYLEPDGTIFDLTPGRARKLAHRLIEVAELVESGAWRYRARAS